MSAFYSSKTWHGPPVLLLYKGTHQCDLFPPHWPIELCLSCRTKCLRTEKAGPCTSSEGLFGCDSEELFSDVREFNGSHSAFVHRQGYLLSFPSPSDSEKTWQLQPVKMKSVVCKIKCLVLVVLSHTSLLSCTSVRICEPLAARVSTKGRWNIHQEGCCFPQGSRRCGPF